MKFNFKKLTIAVIILAIITFTGLKITKDFFITRIMLKDLELLIKIRILLSSFMVYMEKQKL